MVLIFKFNLFEELGEKNLETKCKDQQLIIYFPKCLQERIFKKLERNCLCLSSWSSSRIKRTSKVNCEKLLQLKSNSSCMLQWFVIFWTKKLLQFSLNLYNVWSQRRNIQFRLVFNIRHDYFATKIYFKILNELFRCFSILHPVLHWKLTASKIFYSGKALWQAVG